MKPRMNLMGMTGAACAATLLAGCGAQAAPDAFLVRDGKAQGVIVAPAKPSAVAREAVHELQYHLQRASGATLPVMDKKSADALPPDRVRIVIGEAALPQESFRVETRDNQLIFSGDGKSDALRWAVDYYLDTQLGVRWLWPGEVGTYVPPRADIPLPELDYTGRPALQLRNLRNPLGKRQNIPENIRFLKEEEYQKLLDESQAWLSRFQVGSRSRYDFGHAFTHWWDKYGQTHPEYFAVPPEGSKYKQPWPQAGRVKLNVGNEAIDAAIIAEWQAAGAPDNWNVCPNDSTGFCTCELCRALDDPPNQDPETIWRTATSNLTARYVKFWNRLITKMRKINPDVTLSSYAYSAYRNPPLHGLKLEPGIVLGLVPSYWAEEHWKEWQQAGAQLFLRPNWWHTGGVAPVLPLHRQGEFFKFAQSHNMVGFDSDSLMGYWATQGPLYYVIARLMVRPELSVDAIIDEYCSAFGPAAPEIKIYLNYWEQFTEKAAYPAPAGGAVAPPQPGMVDKIVREHGLSGSPLAQGWQVMPYLYTDEVLGEGYAILDRAAQAAAPDNDLVKQRIQFLREGLDHLKLTREVVRLGYKKQRTPAEEKQYIALAAQLQKLRQELTPQHVIWGETLNSTDVRRHVPTSPARARQEMENLEGM